MSTNRAIWHTTGLYLLPFAVVLIGGGWFAATALVLLALVTRWLVAQSQWFAPEPLPDVQLDSIAASHFVEKVRWSLDRLGIDYVEKPAAGALGAFLLARTVPVLRFRTGSVRSSIGNSAEILRYLYGRYSAQFGEAAAFLEPTPERVAMEADIDAIGVLLQRWIYFHIGHHRELVLRAWGLHDPSTPAWQRQLIQLMYPLLEGMIARAFRLSPTNHDKVVTRLHEALQPFEERLRRNNPYLLGTNTADYCDIAFAAINALWRMPDGYGGGRADHVIIALEQLPPAMREETETLAAGFPAVSEFIDRLYLKERRTDA
ncbi:MAG: glutathione S-transferase N-terminal domain-containing protein [Pseudomonadota bacterium]